MDATNVGDFKRPFTSDLHWLPFVRMFSSPYTATFYPTTKSKIDGERKQSEWSDFFSDCTCLTPLYELIAVSK